MMSTLSIMSMYYIIDSALNIQVFVFCWPYLPVKLIYSLVSLVFDFNRHFAYSTVTISIKDKVNIRLSRLIVSTDKQYVFQFALEMAIIWAH